jgi:hypothetical protein
MSQDWILWTGTVMRSGMKDNQTSHSLLCDEDWFHLGRHMELRVTRNGMQKIACEFTKRYSIVSRLVCGLQQIQLGFFWAHFFLRPQNLHQYVVTNTYITYWTHVPSCSARQGEQVTPQTERTLHILWLPTCQIFNLIKNITWHRNVMSIICNSEYLV